MTNYIDYTGFSFSQYTNNHIPFTANPCPDQIVGQLINGIYIPIQRSDIDYQTANGDHFINNTLQDTIVIVLESPHKYEYDKLGNAIGPAQHTTGRLIDSKFNSLLAKSSIFSAVSSGTHDVVVVNSVQYQCSLGNPLSTYSNKKIRDQIWLNCFNSGCSQDLIDRITAIKPFCVINLCTKGLNNLQQILDKQISKFSNYTCGSHPSTWNFSYAHID